MTPHFSHRVAVYQNDWYTNVQMNANSIRTKTVGTDIGKHLYSK